MSISAVKGIYCNSCVSRTLKYNACLRHDVTLRRGKYQKRATIHIKTSNSMKTSTVVKDFFSSNLFLIHADNISFQKKIIVDFRRKICLCVKSDIYIPFPIEFNGKNGVFGLPVAQKLIR